MQYKHKYEKGSEQANGNSYNKELETIDVESGRRDIITNNINSNIYGKVYFNQYISNGKKYNNILFRDEVSGNLNNKYDASLNSIKNRTQKLLEIYSSQNKN
jgi:hypothetical protein